MVEISPDKKHMRTRDDPGKWSLAGVEPTTFSSLDASVPEFVPGQVFRVPTTTHPSAADTASQPLTGDKGLDSASEVSSRLDEMSVYAVTAAEPAVSEGASAAATEDDYSDAGPQLDSAASFENNEDTAFERLNIQSADKPDGKRLCFWLNVLV